MLKLVSNLFSDVTEGFSVNGFFNLNRCSTNDKRQPRLDTPVQITPLLSGA